MSFYSKKDKAKVGFVQVRRTQRDVRAALSRQVGRSVVSLLFGVFCKAMPRAFLTGAGGALHSLLHTQVHQKWHKTRQSAPSLRRSILSLSIVAGGALGYFPWVVSDQFSATVGLPLPSCREGKRGYGSIPRLLHPPPATTSSNCTAARATQRTALLGVRNTCHQQQTGAGETPASHIPICAYSPSAKVTQGKQTTQPCFSSAVNSGIRPQLCSSQSAQHRPSSKPKHYCSCCTGCNVAVMFTWSKWKAPVLNSMPFALTRKTSF